MLKQPDQVDDILRSVQSGEIPTRDDIIFMYVCAAGTVHHGPRLLEVMKFLSTLYHAG